MPNGTIISNKVTNWTLSDRYRAIEVSVTVARGPALQRAIEVLKGVAANHPGVTKEPAPEAHVVNFASATVSFNAPRLTPRMPAIHWCPLTAFDDAKLIALGFDEPCELAALVTGIRND